MKDKNNKKLFLLLFPLYLLLVIIIMINGMPVKQINKAVWTIPVQTNITLCSPTNNKTFVIPSTTKISSKIEKKKEKKQTGKDDFADMKKMIWMEKSWKQVPVGNDKPEAPKELPRCPKFIPSSLFMR
uniref:Uncharacterized protein n=1 Tax=Meloidogyne enterolobii TaxID=390850 RepID=A0A6V7VUJ6_MELEN|nr:unnamed protein product [Meloidogyne enterolobii]